MAYCETRTITIKARKDKSQNDGVAWSMEENGSTIAGDTIQAAKHNTMAKDDPHLFIFMLDADRGLKLRFLKDPDEVMWVKAGSEHSAPACPNNSSKESEFEIVSVNDETLMVSNLNSQKCKHKFVLNFMGKKPDGSTGLIQYDPIWGNTNGGSR